TWRTPNPRCSPRKSPPTSNISDPHTSGRAAFRVDPFAGCSLRAYTIPNDHAIALTSTATRPTETPSPADTSGLNNSATLAAPNARPAQVAPRGARPSFSTGNSSATIAGSTAITSAATPEGTLNSA